MGALWSPVAVTVAPKTALLLVRLISSGHTLLTVVHVVLSVEPRNT